MSRSRPNTSFLARRRKAFGELGLALRLVHRVPAMSARPEVRRLREAWLGMARRRRIFFDARRRVHLIPLLAVALTVLDDLDVAPRAALRALQTVLDRQFLDRTERSAWSQADILYYLDALGLRHSIPDAATLLQRSSLMASPALAHAQRIDLYAVTHLIFHLSDFGARDLAGATPSQIATMQDYVALALSTCLAEQDFDLVVEFCDPRLLRERPDALSHFAAEALCEAQQPSGFIPDQSWLNGLEPAEDPQERTKQEFIAVYHPTLVALIVLACDMTGQRSHFAGPLIAGRPKRCLVVHHRVGRGERGGLAWQGLGVPRQRRRKLGRRCSRARACLPAALRR